jgi:hypothetical protein
MGVIFDDGEAVVNRIIMVGEYLDRYPDNTVQSMATSTQPVVSKIRFWMQTHQVIDLDGVGLQVADYALAQGWITQAEYDAVLA